MVKQYLELSKKILSSPESEFNFNVRRNVGRISLFGEMDYHDLREGFPALTTKRIGFKTIAHELLWFLRGETNIKYLLDNNVHIWNEDAFKHNLKGMVKAGVFPEAFEGYSESWVSARDEYVQRIREDGEFAQRWGELGPVYGSQWIHWPFFTPAGKDEEGRELYLRDPNGINQIERILDGMRKNPTSSRYLVTAWNPDEVPSMALPPCHSFFHLNSNGKAFDLLLYQRSCDTFLGVPFNKASYAMLTTILAQQLGFEPRRFKHVFGDVHFYCGAGERAQWYGNNLEEFKKIVGKAQSPEEYGEIFHWLNSVLPPEPKGREGMDHVTGILEQLTRTPKQLPKVTIANKPYNQLTIDDFVIEGYDPHPAIKRTLIVG